MLRSILIRPDHAYSYGLEKEQILAALKNPDDLLWVSLDDPSDEEIALLNDVFHFHPLAIEDCMSSGYQTPKIDDFGNYIFLILHALIGFDGSDLLKTAELDIFLGSNYLVTCHRGNHMPPVQTVWDRLNQDERLVAHGSDFLCHAILDHLVDDYIPFIDQIENEIETFEDLVLEKPDPSVLERVLSVKHSIVALRKIVYPLREVLNRLSRDDFDMIDEKSKIYFRDIYDHIVRIQDLSENLRDIISSAMDIYLSATSLRLNEIMKALTVVSTIFLPLSFVAGVYGMNFVHMPEIQWPYGYLYVWFLFLAVGGSMLYWFYRRKWF